MSLAQMERTNMTKILAQALKVGDKIMPPAREAQLWMRRHCKDKGLPETALHLTITDIHEGEPDKRGRWLIVTTAHTAEWDAGYTPRPFKFKARPETPWPTV
jgi:hypothetical protein